MKDSVTLLFLNAGRRVELIQQFRRACDRLKINGRFITTDIQRLAPALYLGDVKILLPQSSSPAFARRLLDVCRQEHVDLVIPLIDPDLIPLGKCRDALKESGTRVLLSNDRILEICRDKYKTAVFLQENKFPTPRVFSLNDPKSWVFPAIIKPRDGSSAEGVHQVAGAEDVETILRRVHNPLIQEFIKGEEITTDVFSNWDARPSVAVPRKRLKVRGGEVTIAQIQRDSELEVLCQSIASVLGTVGPINVQAIRSSSSIHVIEINPRFAGGAPLSIAAGAPLAEWTIAMILEQSFAELTNVLKDKHIMMRYDESIFFSPEELVS